MTDNRSLDLLNNLSNKERVKDDALSAELYSKRKPQKHKSEMKLVEDAFARLPDNSVKSVLDAPCGVGRISVWLARRGYQVTGIDLGSAAVELAREAIDGHGLQAIVEKQNIMAMSFAEKRFDCCICFRLLHHFAEPEQKEMLIRELCRVSNQYVVISYFSPISVTTLRRKLRRKLFGEPMQQNPDTLGDLQEYFKSNGFELKMRIPRSRILHSLQLAIFKRM